MAKKSKNSELLVHYARTMTPENLSRAANYVGGYVLRGLGALGKIFTAPLTGGPMGTNTVPLYPRTVLLANAERKLRETQEKLIGKAMTWISPLNYGAALMTGNGLNAKKGEEEVASWSPAWLAAARLGELYVGPKAVKGVKSAPRIVVNTAAKAGVKPAKAAVVAREIKLATKNKPNIEVSKPIIRTRVGDVEIDNPQLFYRQGSAEMGNDFIKSGVVKTSGGFLNPMYTEGALFKKIPTRTKGGLSKGDKIALEGPYNKTKSDLLVTDSSVDMIPADQGSGKNYTWFEDYMLDPFAEESIFDKSRVPLFNGTATSANTTAYRWEPGYGYKKVVQEPSTSLKFFERKPFNSKLKKSEEAGVPKGERAENNPEVMQNARLFAEKYGYDIPENIDQVKDMYRLHNRFFRTVTTEPFDINPDLYPELKGLSHEQKIKLLASKGYPKFYRSWDPKDVGSGFNDDFVFVSPSVALNIKYSYGDLSNTVMLQRPFSFGKPNEWHINADWKINPSTLNIHTKGMISEGNAPIYDEVKISTEHLIPIKIAEKTDKGSLKKKQGGKINTIELFKQGGYIRKMETAAGGPIKKPIKRLKDGYRYIPDEQNGGWDRISDNSMSDVFATMEFTPKKTKTNSSITRKQSAPSKTYYSAYNPDDVVKGFNALTLGGLNNLSPTQWARRVYDTGKLLTGNMTWSGYTNSWINGNNGLVSLDFKEEHPVLSNSINGGIDLATFSLPKVSLYPVHVALLIATPIAGSYIGTKLGEEVDKYLPEKIQGYGGMLGYMLGGSAGIGTAYKNFSTTPLIHTKYKKLNDVINYPITTAAATIKGKYPWTKKQDIRLKRQLFDDIEEARNFLLKSGYQLEDLPAIRIAKKPQYLEGELGHYSPYYNTVTVKSTINPYSNLPIESIESVGSGFKGLVNHELTHGRLQYFGAFSEYDPKVGYYVPRKDIKTPVFDPFRRKKAGSWTASPDEFDAELSNLLISTGKLPIESVDNILPLQIRFGIWNKNKAREIEDLMLLLRKNREFFKDGGKINAIEQFKKRLTNS